MKKISLLISSLALLLSIISLCVSYRQPTSANIDWAAFLVGVLAVLITILIGWQIYNYLYLKEEMTKLVDKEIQKSQEEMGYALKGMINIANSRAFLLGYMTQALDDNINSLEEILKCRNKEIRKYAINLIMNNLNAIKQDMSTYDGYSIYKGCKQKYIHILQQVESYYKDEIISLINNAKEVDNSRSDYPRFFYKELGSSRSDKTVISSKEKMIE